MNVYADLLDNISAIFNASTRECTVCRHILSIVWSPQHIYTICEDSNHLISTKNAFIKHASSVGIIINAHGNDNILETNPVQLPATIILDILSRMNIAYIYIHASGYKLPFNINRYFCNFLNDIRSYPSNT